MNGEDRDTREIEALRERISALSAAILRISASLDVATVLREVVDSAFVKKLRAKLGDAAADPACIFTERGVGYRMPGPGEA